MNCKPGDLAFIKRSSMGNAGALVEVLHANPGNGLPLGAVYEVSGVLWCRTQQDFKWVVRSAGRKLRNSAGRLVLERPISDANLLPIRPDETPEQSVEAMRRLHDTTAPVKAKAPDVMRPFKWEAL